jgi:RluA family pseudouridine synthase
VKILKFRFEDAILYENSDFILINKPPFLSTLEDRQDPVNILTLARAYEPEAQVCHRLDKDTSGVLAIARHPEAYRHLSMQFENREVTKIYHAVVDGIHNFSDQLVDAPILKQNDGTAKISRAGKDAQTYFSTLQAFKAHTLVECRPVTGRMHQIRVHLARLGASITGDSLYGGKPFFVSEVKRGFNLKKLTDEEPLLKRMALHAQTLQFLLLNNENCSIEAPYPKDFQALIRQLSSNKR